jgi:hypothetical protein
MSFDNFLCDMGECPKGYTIERKNINDNYHPQNCCWIPKTEQSKNRRGVHVVQYEQQEWSVSKLAEYLGITARSVRKRIQRGTLTSQQI